MSTFTLISSIVNQRDAISFFLKCLCHTTAQEGPTCFSPQMDHQGTQIREHFV